MGRLGEDRSRGHGGIILLDNLGVKACLHEVAPSLGHTDSQHGGDAYLTGGNTHRNERPNGNLRAVWRILRQKVSTRLT